MHARENDLVGASFGRGLYVLDDYSSLREIAAGALQQPAALFPVRDAWWYVPSVPMQAPGKPSQGSTDFTASNPPFGAVFTYWLKETPVTQRESRRKQEKELTEQGEKVPFPGWDQLREESLETGPKVLLTVRNAAGEAVRRIEGPVEPGIHRVNWDLRLPPPDPVELTQPGFVPPWAGSPIGPLASPGRYQVEMALLSASRLENVGEPRSFEVKPLRTADSDIDFEAVAAFQRDTSELIRKARGAAEELDRAETRLRHMRAALLETPRADPSLFARRRQRRADKAWRPRPARSYSCSPSSRPTERNAVSADDGGAAVDPQLGDIQRRP